MPAPTTKSLVKLVDRVVRDVTHPGPAQASTAALRRNADSIIDGLKGIVREATGLGVSQRVTFLAAMDAYVAYPGEQTWSTVIGCALDFQSKVQAFLQALRVESGDYVLEPGYRPLLEAVTGRGALIDAILAMDMPEPAQLAKTRNQYRSLIVRLEHATEELIAYTKGAAAAQERKQQADEFLAAQHRVRATAGRQTVAIVVACLVVLAGIVFAGLGVWLVISGEKGATEMTLFGQTLKTGSVGVAAIFAGAVTVVATIRRALKTVEGQG